MKHQNIFSLFGRAFGVLLLITVSVFISVSVFAAADSFEPDNILQNAKPILIDDPRPEFAEPGYDWVQSHNFYDVGDEDWVKFYGVKGEIYTVKVKEPGSKCDAVIGIYDKFGDLAIPKEVNDDPAGKEEYAEFKCESDGIYYARIRQSSIAGYGENTDYKLLLFIPVQNKDGYVKGVVTPCIPGTEVTINSTGQVGTLVCWKENNICNYSMPHSSSSSPNQTFRLTANARIGCESYEYERDITVSENGNTRVDIVLESANKEPPKYHSADYSPRDCDINISEMLRISQLYMSGAYHCGVFGKEDGYAPGPGDQTSCTPHDSDYAPQDWQINYTEFSRVLQFWNMGGYHPDTWGEDGFAPGRQ